MKHRINPWPLILSIVLFAVLLWLGVPKFLGAHPWWSTKVGLIGVPIGLGIGTILNWPAQIPRVIGLAILTVVMFGIAHFGKTTFAASYAENKFAGQMWFFGWIATMACASALALTIFRQLWR